MTSTESAPRHDEPLPAPGAEDVLYVVDVSGYVFRAYHALPPLSSASGEPTHATYGFTTMLQKLRADRRPVLLAAAMDARGHSVRKQLFDGYKANRPTPPPDLAVQMARVREITEALGIPVLSREGYEADDLIASAVRFARAHGLRTVIVSSDKDLMQLVSGDVWMLDTTRDRVFGPAAVSEKLGVPPERVRDLLALMGDSSDNVPGVPGVGPKTANELLARFGSVDELYERLAEVERKSLREKLAASREAAELSRRLVTLHDELPLGIDDVAVLRAGAGDPARLRALYTELGFTRLVDQLPLFETAPQPRDASAPDATKHYDRAEDARSVERLAASVREAASRGEIIAIHPDMAPGDAMRAALRGLAFSARPGAATYVAIDAYTTSAKRLPDVLCDVLQDPDVPKAAHDVGRTDLALRLHGVTLRGTSFDTSLAAYLLDPDHPARSLAELARREIAVVLQPPPAEGELALGASHETVAQSADAVRGCAGSLAPRLASENLASLLADVELPLARVLVTMQLTGVLVDVDRLRTLSLDAEREMARLEEQAHRHAGHAFNIHSPRQLEAILFDELALPVVRKTKTARSTDADVLETLAEQTENPLPRVILEHRQLAKLKGTYLDTLPAAVNPSTGRIHTHFNQIGAATGRLSSLDPNLQNIPVRGEMGREIRRAFVAPPGHVIVAGDYSQIELRLLAHLSEDAVLIDAFGRGEDIHTRTASEVFAPPDGVVTPELRRRAKAINFGVIYGQTDFGLSRELGIHRKEAAAFIAAYFERYQGVARYMRETVELARRTGTLHTLFGRVRRLPDLRSENRTLRLAAERVARNTPLQGSAADILKIAMIHLAERLEKTGSSARLLLTVHDELVLETPEHDTARTCDLVRDAMRDVVQLRVPLVVDVGSGPSWGDAK